MSKEKENAKAEKTDVVAAAEAAGSGGWVDYGKIGVKTGGQPSNNGDRKTLAFLTLEEGRTYRIRLVGKPWRFFRHYEVVRAISPGFEQDVVWKAGHAPRERFSVLVMDKTKYEDQEGPAFGTLKIFEGGPKIFKEFKNYKEVTGKDPGDKTAPDWFIQVKVPSKMIDGRMRKDKRSTEYQIVRDDSTTLTPEEIAYIKENIIDLPVQNKPVDPALLAEMFEEAKTRGDGDPIPGSKEWWKARREKKKGESGEVSDERPLVDAEPETKTASSSKAAPAAADDSGGFGGLFDESEDDKSKASTGF